MMFCKRRSFCKAICVIRADAVTWLEGRVFRNRLSAFEFKRYVCNIDPLYTGAYRAATATKVIESYLCKYRVYCYTDGGDEKRIADEYRDFDEASQ